MFSTGIYVAGADAWAILSPAIMLGANVSAIQFWINNPLFTKNQKIIFKTFLVRFAFIFFVIENPKDNIQTLLF